MRQPSRKSGWNGEGLTLQGFKKYGGGRREGIQGIVSNVRNVCIRHVWKVFRGRSGVRTDRSWGFR